MRSQITRRRLGFSLLEVLVAITLLLLLSTILLSVTGWVANVWNRSNSQTSLRQSDRIISERLKTDLEQIVFPMHEGSNYPFFVRNAPELEGRYQHPNTFCFFAALAANRTKGDVAAVAYFLRPRDGAYVLCRATIGPDEWREDMDISNPGTWENMARADEPSDYQGYLAEGVLGMWVRLYRMDTIDDNGTAKRVETEVTGPFDTRTGGVGPSRIVVDLLIADKKALARGITELPDIGTYTATSYYNVLPESLRKDVGQVSFSQSFVR